MNTRSLWALVAGVSSLVLGCQEEEIKAQVPIYQVVAEPSQADPQDTQPAPSPAPAGAGDGAPSEAKPSASPTPAVPTAGTNAPVAARVVGKATPLPTLDMSAALADVIKLIQAGVSEAVLMAYITNSTNIYHLNSDEIIYLNDLGVSSNLITALIQRDNSPEALAQKQAATAVAPLPPGVALTTPATNIYPAKAAPIPWPETEGDTYVAPAADAQYASPPADPAYVEEPAAISSVSYFNDYLSPYGNWIDVSGYGRCWQPTVAVVNSYWRPYCHGGRWIWSNSGWYWYSDYTWGWGPFHYGRWNQHPGTGWFWVPDTVWAPAWVTWRQTPYYCGWAPLPYGSHYVSGFGLSYHSASVSVGFGFGLGASCYTFVPWTRFCDRKPYYYHVSSSHAQAIYKDSVAVNNYVRGNNNTIINEGVGLNRVAKSTRGEITKASIREVPLNPAEARPERLENDGASLIVVRPSLPRLGATPTSTVAPKPVGGSGKTSVGQPASTLSDAAASQAAPGTRPSSARVGRWQATVPESEGGLKTPGTAPTRASGQRPNTSGKLVGVTPARPPLAATQGAEAATQAASPAGPTTTGQAKTPEQSSPSSPFAPAVSTGRARDTVGVVKSTPGRPYFRVYPSGDNSPQASAETSPSPQTPALESSSGNPAVTSRPVGRTSRAELTKTAPSAYPGAAVGRSGVGAAGQPGPAQPLERKAVRRSEAYRVYPDARPNSPSSAPAARPAPTRPEPRSVPAYSAPAPSAPSYSAPAPVARSQSAPAAVGRSDPAWTPAPSAPQNYSPPARQAAPSVGRAGRGVKSGSRN